LYGCCIGVVQESNPFSLFIYFLQVIWWIFKPAYNEP
jgi:hypothetical protein